MLVTLNDSKVIGPTLIVTIPYTAFAANATYGSAWFKILSRNAKMRTFHISNLLNQGFASGGSIILSDSSIQNGANGDLDAGSDFGLGVISPTAAYSYGSAAIPVLATNVDSVKVSIPIGAAAPTSGNVYIYVTEVLG